MSLPNVTIIDYGMGNLWSVSNALNFLGYKSKISGDPDEIVKAEILLLPGVGSFRKAMESIRRLGLDKAIIESVQARGVKILGICLGMQLMGISSSEDGYTNGLGLIPSKVNIIKAKEGCSIKVPHIGFDSVLSQPDSNLFHGLDYESDFYFVHSYCMPPLALVGKIATCNYGVDFMAAYENKNIFAVQFHPEKSQSNGLILLRNFLLL